MQLKFGYELDSVYATTAPSRFPLEPYYKVSFTSRQLSSSSFNRGSRCTGQVSQNADPKHKVSIKVQKHKIGNYSQPLLAWVWSMDEERVEEEDV
jgi:hypothetical protein